MVPHMAFRVGLLDTTPYESKWVFGPHEIDHKIRAMIIMFLSGDVACRRSMKHPAVCSLQSASEHPHPVANKTRTAR